VALARKLAQLSGLEKVLFAPGGAEAIGMALKVARLATGRHKTISMWDSFHGASLDAISLGGEALFRSHIGPLLPGTEHVQPCDPRHCNFGCGGSCNLRCADYVEYVLAKEEDVAAVVVETVRSTDVQVPPPEYYRRLRAACDRHGALLILDEIPVCLGRTGTMFAYEPYGILPDMVVLGKGLGGGVFPMAALVARADLDIAADRALGHFTHEKSSVGCAAALAALEVIEEENLLARSRRLGARALARLKGMRQKSIVEVRGIGLLLAVEVSQPQIAEEALYRSLARGLSFKVGQGNVLVLAPPLVISEADLDAALKIIEQCLS
jgi:4-aminobutyrate aminotransferase